MTIVQQACRDIPGFEIFYQKFLRRMSIKSRAESTCISYGRSLASMALHFKCLPTQLALDEIEDYLYTVKEQTKSDSDNFFKFAICSLRFVFHMEGIDELRLKLPVIKRNRKLPVVLSKEEITTMMNIPCLMKHRVMIALLYGCGLRCAELRNVMVTDIDINRAVLHVRQGKGKKDRYMPLGKTMPVLLEKYIRIQKPKSWLFPGQRIIKKGDTRFYTEFEPQFGKRSIQWAIKRAAQLAGVSKNISVHSLRHTYATHLLEDGVNILTIKELLGHSHIQTTMIYLHVAQVNNRNKCSPMDTLHGLNIIGAVQGEFDFA